jgi:hypothetical protein
VLRPGAARARVCVRAHVPVPQAAPRNHVNSTMDTHQPAGPTTQLARQTHAHTRSHTRTHARTPRNHTGMCGRRRALRWSACRRPRSASTKSSRGSRAASRPRGGCPSRPRSHPQM